MPGLSSAGTQAAPILAAAFAGKWYNTGEEQGLWSRVAAGPDLASSSIHWIKDKVLDLSEPESLPL